MKTSLLTLVATLGLAASAHAAEIRIPVGKQLFTCAAPGVARISTAVEPVAPCCDGKLKCAEYLSTTSVVKPPHRHRA